MRSEAGVLSSCLYMELGAGEPQTALLLSVLNSCALLKSRLATHSQRHIYCPLLIFPAITLSHCPPV